MAEPTHILAIPYPAQGHLLPFIDMAHHLSEHGIGMTVLVTPKNLPFLSPLLARSPSIRPLILPFPSSSSLPSGVENVHDLPPGRNSFILMMHALSLLHAPALAWARSLPSPPSAILSDLFCGWTQRLAADLSIPHLVFSPSGAYAISLNFALWHRLPPKSPSISFPEIPHSPEYPWWQISPIYRHYCPGDPLSEFIREGMQANMAAWGIVVNTFDELEREYLAHLKSVVGHPRVWAVGPLQPVAAAEDRGGFSSVPSGEIMKWLDKWENGSVLYVCFGSQAVLSDSQMEALAAGLEASQVRFVWSIKAGTLPEGFEDRVLDRGLVIRGWAPQVAILGHRSVGTFLSHCGWNSMLEGLVAGVDFLAWPMTADQFSNATLLVNPLGVAVWVCEGAQTVPDSSGLARAISEFVGVDRPTRARARKLREAALGAFEVGGSSSKELDQLVRELNSLEVSTRCKIVHSD